MMLFNLLHCSSYCGKSIRLCAPRLSLRSRALFQPLKLRKTLLEILFAAKDAHIVLHRFLQVAMHVVWAVAVPALKRLEHFTRPLINLTVVNARRPDLFRMCG